MFPLLVGLFAVVSCRSLRTTALFHQLPSFWASDHPIVCQRVASDPVWPGPKTWPGILIYGSHGEYNKIDAKPDPSDIGQVVAYAQHLGCSHEVLLYPTREHHPIDIQVGDIRVRTLVYPLDGDLDANGNDLIRQLELV